ncbi:hypothetical protein ACOZFM_27095 [Streptomyces arboris]|uniref:hypothetical protein n=1 Tax=Streptomyces arboris TaxID=2600619 RepID=UPI003BF5DA98
MSSSSLPSRGLEVATVTLGSTSVGLAAWIVADGLGAEALQALGAAGASFAFTFTIGMKVLQYFRAES